jgi:cell division protein ZapA (FtsZ GTPase activity inhibitor)
VEGFEPPKVGAQGLVEVMLFGQRYHIKTDNPGLVFRLTYRVQSMLKEALGQEAGRARRGSDALVQAAFMLALKLNAAERETSALKANIEALEERIRRLLNLVDGSL